MRSFWASSGGPFDQRCFRLHNVSTTGVDSRGPGWTPVNNEAAEKARSIKHLDQKRKAINQLAGRAS
jgi:hypothetical protein